MSHVFLIGFMGAGKSQVGREVASMTRMPFVDLDEEVERSKGMRVAEIFESEGEAAFRAAEREALLALGSAEPSVVACGGGIVLDERNRADLKRLGRVVWLRVGAREVHDRVGGGSSRPLLSPSVEGVEALLASREALYEAASDSIVQTSGLDVHEVARGVARIAGVS